MKTIALPQPSRPWLPLLPLTHTPPPPPPPPPPAHSPHLQFLDDLVEQGGPQPEDYPRLDSCFRELSDRGHRSPAGSRLLAAARTTLSPILLKSTVPGFLHLRPHGYPGDFELLERLQSFHHSPDPNLVRWDRYCHSLPAARALRNRKAHLWELLRRAESESLPGSNPPPIPSPVSPSHPAALRILSFRSGPARDLTDYLAATGEHSRVFADCLDPDPNAAFHGRRITARLTQHLTFLTHPLLSFQPAHPYSLVWCPALAESLDDRALVAVLRKMLQLLRPGGKLVVAHLRPDDTTSAFLDVIAAWHLHPRTVRDLEELAVAAGAYPDTVRVLQDPAHPNFYLHIRRPIGRLRRRVRLRPLLAPQPAAPPLPFPASLVDRQAA